MAFQAYVGTYFVVKIRKVNDAAELWLSENAFSYGASGLSEPLDFVQPEGEEEVYTRVPQERAVDVYFSEAPPPEFVQDIRGRFPDLEVVVESAPDQDWLAEWKKSFQPFALVDGHWVVPSWCTPPPEARHKIWIDPGMAFGTGTHETTQLVAEALKDILVTAGFPAQTLLDVGTGTGILAILGRQMGVVQIQATEIEPEARRVANENFALNQCTDIRLDERQIQDLKKSYDIVVANIIDGVLVRLQDDLKACVKPGGWLVVSGIIGERLQDFLSGFKLPVGKEWGMHRQKGDWHLYAVRL